MAEEFATTRQLQAAVEDLQSAMSDQAALQDTVNKGFEEAITAIGGMPVDVLQEFQKVWSALLQINKMMQERTEANFKIHQQILELIGLVNKAQR